MASASCFTSGTCAVWQGTASNLLFEVHSLDPRPGVTFHPRQCGSWKVQLDASLLMSDLQEAQRVNWARPSPKLQPAFSCPSQAEIGSALNVLAVNQHVHIFESLANYGRKQGARLRQLQKMWLITISRCLSEARLFVMAPSFCYMCSNVWLSTASVAHQTTQVSSKVQQSKTRNETRPSRRWLGAVAPRSRFFTQSSAWLHWSWTTYVTYTGTYVCMYIHVRIVDLQLFSMRLLLTIWETATATMMFKL